MTGLVDTIRALARDHARDSGQSVADLVYDSLLGTFAALVILLNVTVLLLSAGGGR